MDNQPATSGMMYLLRYACRVPLARQSAAPVLSLTPTTLGAPSWVDTPRYLHIHKSPGTYEGAHRTSDSLGFTSTTCQEKKTAATRNYLTLGRRRPTWLPRGEHRPAGPRQPVGEDTGLGGFARAFAALECNEPSDFDAALHVCG